MENTPVSAPVAPVVAALPAPGHDDAFVVALRDKLAHYGVEPVLLPPDWPGPWRREMTEAEYNALCANLNVPQL